MIHIFLDDERQAPLGVVRTNTVKDTIELLCCCNVLSLSLDHDLDFDDNGKEMSGYDVICWIENMMHTSDYQPPKKIFCHSQNPVGRKRIQVVIDRIEQYMANHNES